MTIESPKKLILETLNLPPNTKVKDIHARQACLSAWMCLLRQNVGSCFATAPAILIQAEQPMQLISDFQELLSTGKIRRIYGGFEFSVPMSPSWGAGDSKKIIDIQDPVVWHCEGIIASLVASGLVPENLSIQEKRLAVQNLVERIKPLVPQHLSIENLIKAILMDHFGIPITEKLPKQIDNKFKEGSLIPRLPQESSKNNKIHFEQSLQKGLTAFKLFADNPLLKCWEFTIASFSESKADFTRWNLYASLGLRPEQKGGLGESLRNYLQQKVDEYNRKTEEIQQDYERAYARLKYAEGRLQNASTEKEIQWMRAEYQSSRNEFYNLEEMRDSFNRKAKRFANLFNDLLGEYDDLFVKYFQEVYDADLQEMTTGPYDDSRQVLDWFINMGEVTPLNGLILMIIMNL